MADSPCRSSPAGDYGSYLYLVAWLVGFHEVVEVGHIGVVGYVASCDVRWDTSSPADVFPAVVDSPFNGGSGNVVDALVGGLVR